MAIPLNICASQTAKPFLAFISLTVIQIVAAVLEHRSQRETQDNYFPVSAGFAVELLKLIISLALIGINTDPSSAKDKTSPHTAVVAHEPEHENVPAANLETTITPRTSPLRSTINVLRRQVTWKLALHSAALALLYYANHQLSLALHKSVDPKTVSLFACLSSPLVVLMLCVLFNRYISHSGWTALLLQVAGLSILQYDPCIQSLDTDRIHYVMLLSAAIITAVCSVWNEQCVKHLNADLQVQNTVLYSFGTLFHLLGLCATPYRSKPASSSMTLFAGYSWSTVAMIACRSLVGLAVSAVYKYSDAIMQTWASACTTAALLLCHTLFFFMIADAQMYAGVVIVFAACYIYVLGEKDLTFVLVASEHTAVPTSLSLRRRRSILIKAFLLILLVLIGYVTIQHTASSFPARPNRRPVFNVNASFMKERTGVALTPHGTSHSFFEISEMEPIRLNRPLKLQGMFNATGTGLQLTINTINCVVYYFSRDEVICNAIGLLDKLPLNNTVQLTVKAQYEKLVVVQNVTAVRLMTHWERQRILLLICFGQPRYERMAFLSMFEDVFPKVVYAGTVAGDNIMLCPELPWHNHVCIARAIEQYPNYAGYLYQTFDVAVILFNFVQFNTSHVWRAKDYISRDPPFGSPVHEGNAAGWMWSVHPVLPDTKRAFATINSEIQANGPNAQRYRAYMKNLVTNAGAADMRLGSFSDVYYVPARLTSDWVFLTGKGSVFDKCNVIHEIVSPTLSWMITDNVTTTYEKIEGSYLTDYPIGDYLNNPRQHYFHRVNLADKNHRDFIQMIKDKSHVYV